jgi:hypothetical protein
MLTMLKKELRHKVDQIRDAFDRVDRAEREGMTILSEAIDGQSMKELERLSEVSDQLFRDGRYALDDFESDQIHEYDISLNQQLDTLDAQDDILRRNLGDL